MDAYEAVKMAMEFEPPQNGEVDPPTPVEVFFPTSVTNKSMILSWSESSNDDFNRYEIHLSNSQNFIPYSSTISTTIVDRATCTYEITNLKANTTYFFKIRVYNTQNKYADSNEVYVTTLLEEDFNNNQDAKQEFLTPTAIIVIISFIIIMIALIAIIQFRKQRKRSSLKNK